MNWKLKLKNILEAGCTDSDIEDFVESHPEINGRKIWDYVYEYNAPSQCKECKYVQCIGFGLPCTKCSRNDTLVDRYEKRCNQFLMEK